MKFIKPKIKKPKAPGKPRKIGNRTIIGIVCIIAAFAVCFGVAPLVNQVSDEQVEIVRMRNTLLKGSCIGENDIEVVMVGAYNLPKDVIRDKNEVLGKYTTGDMYKGEYLLPERLTADVNTAKDILGSLEGDKEGDQYQHRFLCPRSFGEIGKGRYYQRHRLRCQGENHLHAARAVLSPCHHIYHVGRHRQGGYYRQQPACNRHFACQPKTSRAIPI